MTDKNLACALCEHMVLPPDFTYDDCLCRGERTHAAFLRGVIAEVLELQKTADALVIALDVALECKGQKPKAGEAVH